MDKRGAKSNEAYVREVLGDMAAKRNILIINDEAHHAWRKNPEIKEKLSGEEKDAEREATIWISGLDRIHQARGIRTCYDFSATPFAPSGKKNDEEALFGWIVSDFGLNDGIESGLVKTPRAPVRDNTPPDAATYRSRLYHIYKDDTVRDNINRAAKPEESLPDLVANAYNLLGWSWKKTFDEWHKKSAEAPPPVMITVANRTETAARIKYMFEQTHRVSVRELCDPKHILHIDSKILKAMEEIAADDLSADDTDDDEGLERKISKKQAAARLRETVYTVGQRGKLGEQVRNVISVGMLSEGWDAKNVTHILGLRAFSSQLLCEQVVGRGLRRMSYDSVESGFLHFFEPEYVEIFGIPFSFIPHESAETGTLVLPQLKTPIGPLQEKSQYALHFPNVIRIDYDLEPKLELTMDVDKIQPLILEASDVQTTVDIAPIVDGKHDLTKWTEINFEEFVQKRRMQEFIFETAGEVYDSVNASWQSEGTKFALIGQVIRLVQEYLASSAIVLNPPLFSRDPLRRRVMLMLSMDRIVRHLWDFIKLEHVERRKLVFDTGKRVRSTYDMAVWYTSKPCSITEHSHISHCVFDSTWEAAESYRLEKNPNVAAWVKNDHLGFEIAYVFNGVVRKYHPDFLVRLTDGKMLVLETKGQETRQDRIKRDALKEWVCAVNEEKQYGQWCSDVSSNVSDVDGIIQKWMAS